MVVLCIFFFFKQKTAYEIYQCDWSSDVCSSDLYVALGVFQELLRNMARVRYYPPKVPRPSAPRVSKQPMNTWRSEKSQRMGKT